MDTEPVRGKTLRWTFEDGPMSGRTYEHAFGLDGLVTWSQAGQPAGDDSTARYEVERVNDDVYAVSYLSKSGYTLTTIIDSKTGSLVSFASNEQELSTHHGKVEVAPAA